MNIEAVSQSVKDVNTNAVKSSESTGDGSFFESVEKALSTMNKVSLNDEQDALDLEEFEGEVTSLIMEFYANGGNVIELQDAQLIADAILGSDAMLDLLSYSEVTLNDIFLSNLNGGVLNGSDNLDAKIEGMDFSSLIEAITGEIGDIDVTELVKQIMGEIQTGIKQSAENVKLGEANALFDVAGKLRVEGENTREGEGTVHGANNDEVQKGNAEEQKIVIKGGQDDRIMTDKKTDYQGETKATQQKAQQEFIPVGGNVVSNLDVAEIVLERPIESAGLVNSVLEAMEASITNGKDSLFIKLKPDFLGGIAIKLAMSDEGIVAKIVTGSERTHEMLASQMTNLEAALKDKGIDVARMEILYNPMNQEGQREGSSGQSQNKNGHSRSGIYAIDDSEDDSHLQYLRLIGEDEELEDGVYNA